MSITLEELKRDLLRDPEFRKEYYNTEDLAFEISEMVIEARTKLGLTQKELADKVGTKQSSIARIENGNHLPSISFLQKIARAMGTTLIPPKFGFLENKNSETSDSEYSLPEAEKRDLIPTASMVMTFQPNLRNITHYEKCLDSDL
ncbi:helix-turn-helix transcriptional regulator [Candidatus Falkowbacteria bacterium]|nr:helix-turn-helix transcriptional regulator [Candidatus Falkowbacteria bacterium]